MLAQSSTSRLWLTVGHRHCRACIRARETLLYGVARAGHAPGGKQLLLELQNAQAYGLEAKDYQGNEIGQLLEPPAILRWVGR